jgi:peptidoglycan hydrolase-like protein with peptidoglycan-binding domain
MPATLTRRRVGLAVTLAVTLAAVAVPAVWWSSGETRAEESIPVASTQVVRMDMSATESLPGRLGYGSPVTVKGRGEGTVTWLPSPGATVRRGEPLYRVDDERVPLLYGDLPLYRTLSARNTVGRDVRIVARNLEALGYAIGRQPGTGDRVPQTGPASPSPTTSWVTVGKDDGVLTATLIQAIKRWQRDLGRPETGAVEPGDVVVLAGEVRVEAVNATVGDAAGTALMTVTSTTKVVSVSVDAAEAGGVDRGNQVDVVLPGGKTVRGKVATVGTEVRAPSAEPNDPPKLVVTVTLEDPTAVARIDSADVTVLFGAEVRKGVLAVPVGALVALREGGYAVQRLDGGLVAVEVGMFAKGMVEVSGDGLVEGLSVVTTS